VAKSTISACGAVIALTGLLGAGLVGCSASVKTETPVSTKAAVSAGDLQKDLTERLSTAGVTAKSVTCKDELVGEVGKTARCDVSFGDTNDIEAVATVTKVDGSSVDFDVIPAMTKSQVEKGVAGMAAAASATCASGLDGKVGETTKCELMIDGQPVKRVVEVAKVDSAKLGIELSAYLLLPKQKVEEVLLQKLGADGQPVETVDCVEDVVSKVGSTVECAAVTGNAKTGYVVTLTEVEGDNVDIDYKAKP
jgi:hypothetical protein